MRLVDLNNGQTNINASHINASHTMLGLIFLIPIMKMYSSLQHVVLIIIKFANMK